MAAIASSSAKLAFIYLRNYALQLLDCSLPNAKQTTEMNAAARPAICRLGAARRGAADSMKATRANSFKWRPPWVSA